MLFQEREEIARRNFETKKRKGDEMWKINSGKRDEIGERGDSGRMEKKEKIGGKDFAREKGQIERGRKRRLPTRLKETYRDR